MGWRVDTVGGGTAFMLSHDGDRVASVVFQNEADCHAAGEAVRGFLKRPRVSEILAAKAEVERELVALRSEKARWAGETQVAVDHANAIEAKTFGAERLAAVVALNDERAKWQAERAALQARIVELEHQVPSVPQPKPPKKARAPKS